MPRFFARVELRQRSKDHPDYQRLHEAMEDEGFLRLIAHRRTGGFAELPHATYIIRSRSSTDEVLARAKRAADEVWPKNGILVVQCQNYAWSGLRKVSKA